MKKNGLSLIALAILAAAPIPKRDVAKEDRALLQGTWTLETVKINGKNRAIEKIGECLWITKKGQIVCKDDRKDDESKYPCTVGIVKKLTFSRDKIMSEWTAYGRTMLDEQAYKIDVSKDPKRLSFPSSAKEKDEDNNFPCPLYIYTVSKNELKLCWKIGKHPAGFNNQMDKETCLLIYKRHDEGKTSKKDKPGHSKRHDEGKTSKEKKKVSGTFFTTKWSTLE